MRVSNFYFEFDLMGAVFIIVVIVIGFSMVMIFVTNNNRDNAIEALGCEKERFLQQDVCQIDNTYHFVDADCNFWGFDCTAQLVNVEGFVVEVK